MNVYYVHRKVYIFGHLGNFLPAIFGLEAWAMVFGPVHPTIRLSFSGLPAFCLFYFIFILLHWQQRSTHSTERVRGHRRGGQRAGHVCGGWTFCLCRFVGILTSHSRIIIIRVCFIWPTAAFVRVSWSSSTDFPLFTQKKNRFWRGKREERTFYFVKINILNKTHKMIAKVV